MQRHFLLLQAFCSELAEFQGNSPKGINFLVLLFLKVSVLNILLQTTDLNTGTEILPLVNSL